jgi:hypothetical protein
VLSLLQVILDIPQIVLVVVCKISIKKLYIRHVSVRNVVSSWARYPKSQEEKARNNIAGGDSHKKWRVRLQAAQVVVQHQSGDTVWGINDTRRLKCIALLTVYICITCLHSERRSIASDAVRNMLGANLGSICELTE